MLGSHPGTHLCVVMVEQPIVEPHHCLPFSTEGLCSLLGSLKSKECIQVCVKLLIQGGTTLHSFKWRGLTIRMVSLRIPTVVGFISLGAIRACGNPGGGLSGAGYWARFCLCCSSTDGAGGSCTISTVPIGWPPSSSTSGGSCFTQNAGSACQQRNRLNVFTPLWSGVSVK